jgi:hypothetical protein
MEYMDLENCNKLNTALWNSIKPTWSRTLVYIYHTFKLIFSVRPEVNLARFHVGSIVFVWAPINESRKMMQPLTMWSGFPSLPMWMLDPQQPVTIVVQGRIYTFIHIHSQIHNLHKSDWMLTSSWRELKCNMQSSHIHVLMMASNVSVERSAIGARKVSPTLARPNKQSHCHAQPATITL